MFVRYFVEVPLPADRAERAREPVGLEGLLPRPDATVDRVLHRVAEATLKDFLDRLASAIALSDAGGAATMTS